MRPFYVQLFVLTIAPVCLGVIAGIVWIILWFKKFKGKALRGDNRRQLGSNIIASFIILIYLLHPQITQQCLNAFKCVNLGTDDEPEYYLEADYQVKCWEGKHAFLTVALAVPCFLFWGNALSSCSCK